MGWARAITDRARAPSGTVAMNERHFHAGPERLRSPERLALLETERVAALALEGLRNPSVLDVGTGTGVFAEAFAPSARKVVGMDPDAGLLALAATHVPTAQFHEGTAEALPFDNASFDLVFLGHVLHETDDPAAALREARRVSRGRVAVLEWPWASEGSGPPLEHRLMPEQVERFARDAGFLSIERIRLKHMDFYRLDAAQHQGTP